jgi:hypothetical protein
VDDKNAPSLLGKLAPFIEAVAALIAALAALIAAL